MNIVDLIKCCEAGFSSVSTNTKREGFEISSGGNDVPGDTNLRTEPAALYATEDLALGAWLAEFNRSVEREGQSLIWVERPYVELYRITLSDKYNSYRVVRDRYVARGTVAVEVFVPETVAAPLVETAVEQFAIKPKRKAKAS